MEVSSHASAGMRRTHAFVLLMGILHLLLDKVGLGGRFTPRPPARVFLLDDDVMRHEWFARQFKGDQLDVAADAARAVELLSSNYYDLIFLDHDLLPEHYYAESFDDERTGYAVARWLAERPARLSASHIVVHTRNADGALRMVELLRRVGRQAEHVPFPQLAPKIKQLRRR
jgi:CheY-like chemotaxis protein